MDIQTEVETLNAIYGDKVNYENNILSCTIEEIVDENLQIVKGEITIKFTIPEDYPETHPTFVLESKEDFIVQKFERIEKNIKQIIEEEFTCLFELVDRVKDMVIEILKEQVIFLNEEIIRKEKEEEKAREKEFIGSTKKTFEEWWKDKEKERKITLEKIKREKEAEINRKKGRMTGKEFFMNNPRMVEQLKEENIRKEEEEEEKVEETLKEQGVDLEMFTEELDI
ncbi:RWD domain-containing protein, putative [Entamoeba dispar SAW760]|uniref:RWD domain-containing protein, putative n=1 Tax=Entamoeba dispar (strain ATCC PRA-260 / SAW760) TaxID=370354 RepID=B0ECA4_ENTDS|nr:RWD domain-containing protein, putative [Entamoeba dispar SAW760]EDR27828.1 RWD domain-containing protein, putative [Entamoeba dispar SAW760]|eukprot:EDR27828.1 RWD domain-containing protein, putative [Entamoeba dispar SAW760]